MKSKSILQRDLNGHKVHNTWCKIDVNGQHKRSPTVNKTNGLDTYVLYAIYYKYVAIINYWAGFKISSAQVSYVSHMLIYCMYILYTCVCMCVHCSCGYVYFCVGMSVWERDVLVGAPRQVSVRRVSPEVKKKSHWYLINVTFFIFLSDFFVTFLSFLVTFLSHFCHISVISTSILQ